ncbi:sulfolipid (UDP-sulfoquinovose) biosynthesis protein [mine drainage metagenome]|uniref:Sulfolipid (UDP-sulfoquinovose) biosynthesis protein n=1 Tax=mine drainage metagenome TaxID=410659 RepID=T0ZKB9_9ZZZZ
MKVLITGIDGYSGWPLALHLLSRGHDVVGVDNFVTRRRVREVGSWSATPIPSFAQRQRLVNQLLGKELPFHRGDLGRYDFVARVLEEEHPDAIVHLAEQRSAPYSMIDVHHAVTTQVDNVVGTLHLVYAMRDHCPDAHLVKMGTMGEYGTPNVDIPEGFFEIEYRGRKDRLPFPRQAGSWYHWSKVFDSGDVMFASKIFDLRATDVMQGVIYGIRTAEMTDRRLLTRFDFDETWGTALNRFIAQAVLGLPITPYGKGEQIRGFIALEDSVQSLRLAVEHPADRGEYRVLNQFDAAYSINQLAEATHQIATELGLSPRIEHPPDPRIEAEQHYYAPIHERLYALGYQRTRELSEVMREIFADLLRYRRRLEARRHVVMPTVDWRRADNPAALNARVAASSAPPSAEPLPPVRDR